MGKMMECISEPRKELSKYAPKITTIHVDPDKIAKVIGPGGKCLISVQVFGAHLKSSEVAGCVILPLAQIPSIPY